MKPITFAKLAKLDGLTLETGQRVYAAVAFDGVQPADLGADRERGRLIFGDVEHVPVEARRVVAQVKGRDVGGSRLGALRGLHLALTADLNRLELGEFAHVFFVAPKLRLARVAKRFALAAAKRRKGLRIENEAADGFTLVRHDGRRVIFECIAASRGGDTGRGVPVLFVLLDEACFFRDEATGVVNDAHVFAALVPRLLPVGQILIVSSPWAESGLLFDEFQRNFGKPSTALAALCPTPVMRDDNETLAAVDRERARDPENARREFDAEFLPAGSGLFFDHVAISRCIDETLPSPLPTNWRPAA